MKTKALLLCALAAIPAALLCTSCIEDDWDDDYYGTRRPRYYDRYDDYDDRYDRHDDYLMRNELMAYIMQQALSRIGPYFVSLAERSSVNQIEGDLAAYIRRTGAAAFSEAGGELNQWAFDNYGFAAGRVNLLYRDSSTGNN